MKDSYLVKYNDENEWEPVELDKMKKTLKKYYVDVGLVINAMHDGLEVITPWSRYKLAKED